MWQNGKLGDRLFRSTGQGHNQIQCSVASTISVVALFVNNSRRWQKEQKRQHPEFGVKLWRNNLIFGDQAPSGKFNPGRK